MASFFADKTRDNLFSIRNLDEVDGKSETRYPTNHASTIKKTARSSNSRLSIHARSDVTDETVEPLIEDILPSVELEL